jgi:serine/threonine protein kinase
MSWGFDLVRAHGTTPKPPDGGPGYPFRSGFAGTTHRPERGMRRSPDHGRLPTMTGERLPSSGDNATGTDWVLGGRYRLISQVGAGGMAVVWQAYDNVLARTVAVKVLATHHADDPQARDRIRREARAAAVLSHPNIAQVYDYGEAGVFGEVTPYVVMELIRGRTLHQRLGDGPILPRYAMRVCAEIAAALAAAHAEGLAHRDIKPANVMLAPTGAKVVDFGIADAIRPAASDVDDFEVLGTPAYLAPERLLHDAVEPASDVYALGVLLYRLLAGHSPWTSETTTQMLTAHIYLEPAPLPPMSRVPDYVTALCNRCLAKDPAARPSAREAAALLARGAGLQVITDEQPPHLQTGTDTEPSVLIRAAADRCPPHTEAAEIAALQPSQEDHTPSTGTPPAQLNADPLGPVPADREIARSQLSEVEPVAMPSDPGHPAPAVAGRRHWVVYALVAVAVLAGLAGTLWPLRPAHREAAAAAPTPGLEPTGAASGAAVNPLPGAPTTPATTAPGGPAAGPATVIKTADRDPEPVPATPGNPAGSGPATATPPTAATTTPAGEPIERTLSSAAASVLATCPATDTAQILSWTAVKPYKITQGDSEAGPSPEVTFKHGNDLVTMTVTCVGGVPSVTST